MTSEVVVMNRLGIALASDSAATVYAQPGRAKFYQADKLFMLSNYHPVGVMVYSNSSLMGIPWETILKMFRAKLGPKPFPHLEDYATELIKYLDGNQALFPKDVQDRHFKEFLRTIFRSIEDVASKRVIDELRDDPDQDGSTRLAEVRKEIVERMIVQWRKKTDATPSCLPDGGGAKVMSEASGVVNDAILSCVPSADQTLVPLLRELAQLIIDKEDIFPDLLSGVVIAGFGVDEHFPVMQEYHVGEVQVDKLKYKLIGTHRISSDQPSIIQPFAQSEMVETFLSGLSPVVERQILKDIVLGLMGSADGVIDNMPGVGKKAKEEYKTKVRAVSKDIAKGMVDKLKDFRERKHRKPILQSIEFLPKNELAHVAASLVNLSSFQKRVTISEDETVGGPIDVAVISKGDGFVWIERKHYFRPELNRHFFRNRELADNQSNSGSTHGQESGNKEGAETGKDPDPDRS